jgi:hypothetical protein
LRSKTYLYRISMVSSVKTFFRTFLNCFRYSIYETSLKQVFGFDRFFRPWLWRTEAIIYVFLDLAAMETENWSNRVSFVSAPTSITQFVVGFWLTYLKHYFIIAFLDNGLPINNSNPISKCFFSCKCVFGIEKLNVPKLKSLINENKISQNEFSCVTLN